MRGLKDQTRWSGNTGSMAVQPRHRSIVAAARISPGMRVLDIATGRGEVAVMAALLGAEVHATDISEALLAAAATNARVAGVRITTSICDMRELTDLAGRFDRVLGCAALHHLDPEGSRVAVQATMSILEPQGRALFVEPVENVAWFDFLKHLVPGPNGRPSSLRRKAWSDWAERRDDRWMSDEELLGLWPRARIVGRVGFLQRIKRTPLIENIDAWLLTHGFGRFAQASVVEYEPWSQA